METTSFLPGVGRLANRRHSGVPYFTRRRFPTVLRYTADRKYQGFASISVAASLPSTNPMCDAFPNAERTPRNSSA